MRRYTNPDRTVWSEISERPTLQSQNLEEGVGEILSNVQLRGDAALKEYTEKFEGVRLEVLAVRSIEIQNASQKVSSALKEAMGLAKKNIERFHAAQREPVNRVITTKGVECWRESRAIETIGLYIPGGTAPLFSTVLMLGVPANLAGCKEVVLCTPPREDGSIDPAILYAANLVGISRIFKVGGAQAIAAMAYGTESIPRVDKIFGPGNQFVTKAKELVQRAGTAIDMPAGPSEVLVIADETCNASFVAADLLSQAEHGPDSQVVLLSPSERIIDEVIAELKIQLQELPRKEIASQALRHSRMVILNSLDSCVALSNYYAPEHLIIASDMAEAYIHKIQNAGSVFIGHYSCESAGDYASGTNHTLPTNGFARSYSGVSLDSFIRKITFQRLTAEGIQRIGPAVECMAEAEQLYAHKNAVTLRLKSLRDD